MPWKVLEKAQISKSPGSAGEDRLVIADSGVVAVIDGATDKSGRSYGGSTGGVRAAECVAGVLADPETASMAPREAVDRITAALAAMRSRWGVPTGDPVAPSAVAAVFLPQQDLCWRVGDVSLAYRISEEWVRHLGTKAIDGVLAGARAAYLQCRRRLGDTVDGLLAQDTDPGRALIQPVLEQQGILANTTGPFGYGVLDGTDVPDQYIEIFPLDGASRLVLASDGYLSPAPTLRDAEDELAASLAADPLRIDNHPATKAVTAGASSFDDRTYVGLITA